MPIAKHLSDNFNTLGRAFDQRDVCLMHCQEVATSKEVALICAVNREGDGYSMAPFAVMIDGNPYDLYRPPNPDGGFLPTDQEQASDE